MSDKLLIGWADGTITRPVYPDEIEEPKEENKETRYKLESEFARSICLNLSQWDKIAFGMGIEFIESLIELYHHRPSAMVYLIELMATNFERKKISYSKIATEMLSTKQNVEQLEQKDQKAVLTFFPQMRSLIDPTGKIEL